MGWSLSLPVDSSSICYQIIWFLLRCLFSIHNLLNELEEHLKTETMKPVMIFLINQRQTVHFLTDSTLHFILNSVLQAGGNVAAYAWPMTELCKSRAGIGFFCRFVDNNSHSCALKGVKTLRVAAGKEKHQHETRGHECCTETFIITTFFLRIQHTEVQLCDRNSTRVDRHIRADALWEDKRCDHSLCKQIGRFWWFTLYSVWR